VDDAARVQVLREEQQCRTGAEQQQEVELGAALLCMMRQTVQLAVWLLEAIGLASA
jgi:hypothetical protein